MFKINIFMQEFKYDGECKIKSIENKIIWLLKDAQGFSKGKKYKNIVKKLKFNKIIVISKPKR